MYESAKNYRSRFLKKHGEYEHLHASVRGNGVRIEFYHRDDGRNIRSIVVLVDDRDRKRFPFDHESRVEGYISSKEAIFWFREYCKRYGLKGRDVDRAVKKLWAME